MYNKIKKIFLEPQSLISYMGIIPFLYILFDIHKFKFLDIASLKEFCIYYSLIIFSFIGGMRWNFNLSYNSVKIFYGFAPSLISTILIYLSISNFDKNLILFTILFLLTTQLIFDFYYSDLNNNEAGFFRKVRLPVTTLILITITYIISV